MKWDDALEIVGLPQAAQDEMKLQMAKEAHDAAITRQNNPEFGREQQDGDTGHRPNQEPKKPSPAREANEQ
jgi:hypothetical protein